MTNGVYLTATGDLLRAGEVDFSAAPDFAGGTETVRTDVPLPALIVNRADPHHRWNGAAWVTVAAGASPQDGEDRIVQAFTFATASPLDFGTVAADDEIMQSELVYTTAFDASSTVDLGLTSAPGGLIATAENDPEAAATYSANDNTLLASADTFRLRITPGASAAGEGRAVITIRRG